MLTGYQVEWTTGRELLEIDGRVMPIAAQAQSYDSSADAGRHGLPSFLDSYRGAEVLENHGDRRESFAEELRDDGFDASAPELGETVDV